MNWINYLLSFSWWQYLLALLLGGIGFIGFIFYRGYSKVRPKPIKGIPCPAFTHALLGHPEGMIHPIRHDIRSHFSENFPYNLYQLCLMNHNAVFANDPAIVAQVLSTSNTKGSLYSSYRYHPEFPDILACDGEAYEQRKNHILPDLVTMTFPSLSSDAITRDLLQCLETFATNQETLDIKKLFTLFSLDRICEVYFSYNLQAVKGSPLGVALYHSLHTIYDAGVNNNNLYDFPNLRKVSEAELLQAKEIWKTFLETIYHHISEKAKDDPNGDNNSNLNYGTILMRFQQQTNCSQEEIINEIHLLLRHGSESIMGTCLWMSYVITRNDQIRQQLEQAVSAHLESHPADGFLSDDNYPVYLECFLKELLRRYPVMGNMTVRTVGANDEPLFLEGVEIPRETPIHLHMHTMHHREKNWVKAREFHPERWLETPNTTSEEQTTSHELQGNHPTCPFLSSAAAASSSSVYEGVGFEENSLSYFPFSAGERICLGRSFALTLLRRVLYDLVRQYRFRFAEGPTEEDYGVSIHTIIIPFSESSSQMKVQKVQTLGVLEAKKGSKKARVTSNSVEETGNDNSEGEKEVLAAEGKENDHDVDDDDGWADDNDFDDFKNTTTATVNH